MHCVFVIIIHAYYWPTAIRIITAMCDQRDVFSGVLDLVLRPEVTVYSILYVYNRYKNTFKYIHIIRGLTIGR
jgi:hypothetical protein